MTDTNIIPDIASKPAISSTTIQGAILSIAGALAPTLADFLHLQADDVTKVVSAVVVLIGFTMTIVGRFTAKQPLH